MTGSDHSIDMVVSVSMDTAVLSFLNIQARGLPEFLPECAWAVSHIAGEMQEEKKQTGND